MMTPTAPAAWAFIALVEKKQAPLWISAIFPAVNPAKSSGSQPLVTPPAGVGIETSTASTGAVTSPLPEKVAV